MANAEGWLSGWVDVPLTAQGVEEARAASAEAAGLPFRRILVSDLARARSTAEELLRFRPGVPLHVDAGLRERHLGVFQGRRIAEVWSDPASRAILRTWDDAPPGGETHAALVRRALATLRSWDDGTPTLVVAHGALIRDVLGVLDGKAPELILQDRPAAHCALAARAYAGLFSASR